MIGKLKLYNTVIINITYIWNIKIYFYYNSIYFLYIKKYIYIESIDPSICIHVYTWNFSLFLFFKYKKTTTRN